MVSDAATTLVAFVAASWLRFGDTWEDVWMRLLPRPGLGLAFYAAVAVATFWLAGMYRLRSRWTLKAELKDIALGVAALILVTFSMLYVFKLDQVSRLFLIYFFTIATVTVTLIRACLRHLFRRLRRRDRALRHTLIVGSGEEAFRFLETLNGFPEIGVRVVGFVGPKLSLDGLPRLGAISDLPTVLAKHVIDEVAICLPFRQWGQLDHLISECELQGKTVRIPATSIEALATRSRVERLGSTPVITLSRAPDRALALAVKRAMDIVGAAVGLVLTSPIILAAAAAILLEDGRPVFFSHTRVGLHGRHFSLHKLRTMVRNAEELKEQLAHLNERRGPAFKVSHDPRITRVGRHLRRWSIDELPQFWNVLKGDMSLVGPRPPTPDEVVVYDPWHRARLSMRPGVSGLWQVSAREEPDFDRWVEIDIQYISSWSLTGDLHILARTVPTIVGRTGR